MAVMLIGGEVVEGKPKTKAGERRVWLDAVSAAMVRAHRQAPLAARLRASTAWQNNDLIFAREDGSPDYVSRRFKAVAAATGLRVIKLHEGRHSAGLRRAESVIRSLRGFGAASVGESTAVCSDG